MHSTVDSYRLPKPSSCAIWDAALKVAGAELPFQWSIGKSGNAIASHSLSGLRRWNWNDSTDPLITDPFVGLTLALTSGQLTADSSDFSIPDVISANNHVNEGVRSCPDILSEKGRGDHQIDGALCPSASILVRFSGHPSPASPTPVSIAQ